MRTVDPPRLVNKNRNEIIPVKVKIYLCMHYHHFTCPNQTNRPQIKVSTGKLVYSTCVISNFKPFIFSSSTIVRNACEAK